MDGKREMKETAMETPNILAVQGYIHAAFCNQEYPTWAPSQLDVSLFWTLVIIRLYLKHLHDFPLRVGGGHRKNKASFPYRISCTCSTWDRKSVSGRVFSGPTFLTCATAWSCSHSFASLFSISTWSLGNSLIRNCIFEAEFLSFH